MPAISCLARLSYPRAKEYVLASVDCSCSNSNTNKMGRTSYIFHFISYQAKNVGPFVVRNISQPDNFFFFFLKMPAKPRQSRESYSENRHFSETRYIFPPAFKQSLRCTLARKLPVRIRKVETQNVLSCTSMYP